MVPRILNLSTSWRWVVNVPGRRCITGKNVPGTHWTGGCTGRRAGQGHSMSHESSGKYSILELLSTKPQQNVFRRKISQVRITSNSVEIQTGYLLNTQFQSGTVTLVYFMEMWNTEPCGLRICIVWFPTGNIFELRIKISWRRAHLKEIQFQYMKEDILKKACTNFVVKPDGKRALGRPRSILHSTRSWWKSILDSIMGSFEYGNELLGSLKLEN